MNKKQQSERDEVIAKLRETLKPGDTLHTVLRSVSRSGMSRVIDVYKFYTDDKGQVQKEWLSYRIAKACGLKFQDRGGPEGIKIDGCGMDMGFEIVYTLGRVLFPEGFGIECSCSDQHLIKFRPETAEQADLIVKNEIHTFRGRNGDASGWDTDGGYALKQEWL